MDEQIRKGSADAIEAYVTSQGGQFSQLVRLNVETIAKQGGTPLVVAEKAKVLGVIATARYRQGGDQGTVW